MDNSQNPIKNDPLVVSKAQFSAMTRNQQLDFIFTYQAPRPDQIPKFVAVREALLSAALVVEENCPKCADTSHTLRLLRDARMWANAAIALDGVV